MASPDQREAVFARIREALRRPAPRRHDGHIDYDISSQSSPAVPPPKSDAFRAWLPEVGPGLQDQISLFGQNAAMLKADFRVVDSTNAAGAAVAAMAVEYKWQRVATHRHLLASAIAEKSGLPCLTTDPGYVASDLERCDAAITGCDALVAQTGSVLVTSKSAGGRALSVLPPHHIVVARIEQMVPDLVAALQIVRRKYAPNWPSFLSFITGPSRTGDIERILVLGAHGPKKLTIFLLP